MNTNLNPLSWTPHEITHVEASVEEPRAGFVGRAAAMRIDGVECIVMCRNDGDLTSVGCNLTDDNFDPRVIYKATLINSAGIDVVLQETPPAPPIVPEVQPTPTTEAEEPATPVSDIPVRKDDGLPVATYKSVDREIREAGERAIDHLFSSVEEDDDEL